MNVNFVIKDCWNDKGFWNWYVGWNINWWNDLYNKYLFKYDVINILVIKLVLILFSVGEMSSEGLNINCLFMD